jgi:hypothetical protein
MSISSINTGRAGGAMDRDQLSSLLFQAAESRAKAHGTQLGQGADADIRGFARTGAERILTGLTDPVLSNAAITDAQAAFVTLVDAMVEAASEIPGYRDAHPAMIGEQTLKRALARLCPLFPIC